MIGGSFTINYLSKMNIKIISLRPLYSHVPITVRILSRLGGRGVGVGHGTERESSGFPFNRRKGPSTGGSLSVGSKDAIKPLRQWTTPFTEGLSCSFPSTL